MKTDDVKKLEDERDHLQNWLKNLSNAQDLVPDVLKRLEQIEWAISALKNAPEESEDISSPSISTNIDRDYKLLPIGLPMIPEYSRERFSSTDSTAGSVTAAVYELVARIGDLNTPDSQSYSQKYTELFYGLDVIQKRQDDVRNLLVNLSNQNTINRFDKALKALLSYKIAVGDKESASNSMRNLIEGVQGVLFEKARTSPKEKNITWKIMSARLIKVNASKEEIDTLLDQEIERNKLINLLSTVLKDREGISVTNLEYIWTQLLEHIFIVLNLVSL